MAGNPGNPALSPHAERRKAGTSHTDKTVEKKGGTEGEATTEKSPHAWHSNAQGKRW